ncbi:uncharacterized protein FIBRA_02160 [Fibroporia radiculosa]|uniref:Uncharacterized protein n=1 Tax=Fibroporia radiculosa TaxID=599839 RepID=J4G1D9_9APHY|nr:uncharacterized protein FIBRA_02160 [Fibroporia radiculosa]CCM00133.1 predicted protein [Fibroporia radiculosa]
MAQPSSSHRERERERERSSSSRHHHHRTISSTTLLLVLSLVLAVLAIMLSLPSSQANRDGATSSDPANQGLLGYLTPKRTQALIARESNVAMREAEVARREAEILAGAPGGVIANQPPVVCPPCPTVVEKVTEPAPPIQTVIKEVVKEESLTPPGWWDQARVRAEDILDRELKIAEREREISRREEAVNRREHDASRRESWIMEQLVALNNDESMVEEEVVYDPRPASPMRRPKAPLYNALPPPLLTETALEIATETRTVTRTQHHTVPTQVSSAPPPANTRIVLAPTPELVSPSSFTTHIPRTTAVEVITEEPVIPEPEEEEEEAVVVKVKRNTRQRSPPPASWLNGW